jgi:hypothetical protein
MRATKSALCSGGITQHLCRGCFFERLSDRFIGESLHMERDELVGQQL